MGKTKFTQKGIKTDSQENKNDKLFPEEEKEPVMTNKRSIYIIRLYENDNFKGTYRVNKKMFQDIQKAVEPYRSFGAIPKKVKCIETGKIYRTAKEAAKWLYENNITKSWSADSTIKSVCKGNRETSYGYHWEYVAE